MSDNLKQKTLSAIKWSAVDRIGQQALQLIVGIVLARNLPVEAFALIAMLVVFSALSSVLIDSGFGQALIRKKTDDPREFNTIFLFNVFVGVSLYILLYFASPAIAAFYEIPELTIIARVLFLAIPLNSLYLIPAVKLGMVLDFKSISKVNLIATAISGAIALTLAFRGFEVWAIVWQQLSFHFFRMIVFYLYVRWKPGLYFSMNYIREHWKFSINLLGTASLNAIFNNFYTFVFGKFYSPMVLGHYYQANKQAETVNYTFMSIFTGSSFNVFSQINEDIARLRRALKEFISKVAIVVIPVGFFLIFSAESLIVVIIKDKWLPAVPYFQLIVAANLVAPLYQLNLNALNSRGFSQLTFRIELVKKLLILIFAFLLIKYGGIAMISGYTLITWFTYLVTTRFVKLKINYYWQEQLRDLFPALLIGILVGLGCYLINFAEWSHLPALIAKAAISTLIYLTVLRLVYKDMYDKMKLHIIQLLRGRV